MNKKTQKEVQKDFIALLNSCVEGTDGTWDPTGEGSEGFEAMHSILRGLAGHFKVDISKAKEF
jgi:hypothetical protein